MAGDIEHLRVESRDPLSPHSIEALNAYFAELAARFPEGFDAGDAVTAEAAAYTPSTNGDFLLVLDHTGDAPLGCGGLMDVGDDTVEIKRMWVDRRVRGQGVGKWLLKKLEERGAELGYSTVRLDTNSALTEAIAMYSSAGYESIERFNDNPYAKHWFRKSLKSDL